VRERRREAATEQWEREAPNKGRAKRENGAHAKPTEKPSNWLNGADGDDRRQGARKEAKRAARRALSKSPTWAVVVERGAALTPKARRSCKPSGSVAPV